MRKKLTLPLVVGAFALAASMAIAPAALATHEEIQNTINLTGSVVSTYDACPGPPTSTKFHASPVEFPSCALTASSDTSNLLKPKAPPSGFTSIFNVNDKVPSNVFGSADVVDIRAQASATGVLCETTGTDISPPTDEGWISAGTASAACPTGVGGGYNGPVLGESTVRVTDADNCPGAAVCADDGTSAPATTIEHATVQDFDFSFVIPCTGAGSCSILTSVDAQFGSPYTTVKDPTDSGNKASIEVMSVRVQDPGGNALAGTACPLHCGDGDETDSARQGIWVK